MKIRTSLQVTSVFSVLVMAAAVVSSLGAFQWLRQATTHEAFLVELQGNVFERTLLRDEFLLSQRHQDYLRLIQKTTEIDGHLKQLAAEPLAPAASLLRDRMGQHFLATQALDSRIADLLKAAQGNATASESDRRIRQRLTSQLLVQAYLLSDSTKSLLLLTRGDTIQARNNLLLLLVLSILAVGLCATSATVYLNQLLAHRVGALKTGTDLFSSGNLDYRIPVEGNDELSDLAREANDMARKLQEAQARLEMTNRELEAFSYSVSHDLRAPLRHLTGFVELLNRVESSKLDDKSRHYLEVISTSAIKMGQLIDDLLSFSRMGRGEMMQQRVDLNLLTQAAIEELSRDLPPDRLIQWRIGKLPVITGDQAMLRLALMNLLSNAVKYSKQVEPAVIEVDAMASRGREWTLFVRDNGVGFDMKFVDKLFGLFQRLHASDEYEGTGVGLANVRRIITRHGGRTWAEGALGKGATIYFTLPEEQETRP